MSNKAKLNYIIDLFIALFFVLSALSGLILFFYPSGYQGGRNPYYGQTVFFVTTHNWDALHTWSSIAMIAGVGAHLVLHWNWMVCVTRRLLARPRANLAQNCPLPIEQ